MASRGGKRGRAPEGPARWPHDVPGIVLTALAHVRATGGDASAAARLVLAARALHSRHRSRAGDLLFALARWTSRLDARIRHAGHPGKLSPEERDRLRLAALLAAEENEPPEDVARQLSLPVETVRALTDPHFLDALQGAERLSVEHGMPRWMVELLLEEQVIDDVNGLLGALNARAPLYLRAHRDRDAVLRDLDAQNVPARPTPWSPLGIELLRHVNVRALPSFQDGQVEVQDLGSQLIAMAVAPKPGELVVDACAGAGGKTLALAAMQPGATLWAMEPVPSRLDALKERAARAGVRVQSIRAAVGEENTRRLWGRADAVLVDAPCSGTGALRREPMSRWRYRREDIDTFAAQQARIARLALHLLKPGGRMIYATCSLFKKENEDVVRGLLDERSDVRPVPMRDLLGPVADELGARDHELRVLPHAHATDGFYMAALQLVPAALSA